jgi:ABC-type polysaccharide/polyol phosphate transport system ATPase subunit
MDDEATGIENIYLRGLQMGINLAQLRELVPEVVAFTELGDSIHQIFNTYSTGMQLRLAVAISTMITPTILLMDEWIGSGDEAFRKKVNERMQNVVNESQSIILASHSDALLREHCNIGWVMEDGYIVFAGDINDAIAYYHDEIL